MKLRASFRVFRPSSPLLSPPLVADRLNTNCRQLVRGCTILISVQRTRCTPGKSACSLSVSRRCLRTMAAARARSSLAHQQRHNHQRGRTEQTCLHERFLAWPKSLHLTVSGMCIVESSDGCCLTLQLMHPRSADSPPPLETTQSATTSCMYQHLHRTTDLRRRASGACGVVCSVESSGGCCLTCAAYAPPLHRQPYPSRDNTISDDELHVTAPPLYH